MFKVGEAIFNAYWSEALNAFSTYDIFNLQRVYSNVTPF